MEDLGVVELLGLVDPRLRCDAYVADKQFSPLSLNMKSLLSKWFCDTSTGAAIGATCCGSFVREEFGLLVVSYE
jgi:hypothetical protein